MKLLKNNKCKSMAQRGASMVEYAILVALIVVIAIAAVKLLGQKVSGSFSTSASQI